MEASAVPRYCLVGKPARQARASRGLARMTEPEGLDVVQMSHRTAETHHKVRSRVFGQLWHAGRALAKTQTFR